MSVEFNPDDVKKVAEALLEWHIDYDVTCGRNAYNECKHCSGKVYWNMDAKDIKHDSDCVVLIARDLVTGL